MQDALVNTMPSARETDVFIIHLILWSLPDKGRLSIQLFVDEAFVYHTKLHTP
ncbi:MAG: hypothetical protein AAF642_01640 [Pseudomonadota bacterium]